MGLYEIFKTSDNDEIDFFKKEFRDKWEYLDKKLAYSYECFNSIDDYQKPVNNSKKENVFSNLRNACLCDEKIEKTKKILKLFDIKDGKETAKFT